MFYPILDARPSGIANEPRSPTHDRTTPVITTNEFACISHLHNRRFGEGWWGEGYSTSLIAHSVADRLSHHNERNLPGGVSLFFRLYGWRGHLRGLHTWVAVWPARHACAAALPFSFATIFRPVPESRRRSSCLTVEPHHFFQNESETINGAESTPWVLVRRVVSFYCGRNCTLPSCF